MFDVEVFIREVEKEQCLWRVDNNDYKDQTEKIKAWIKIARVMYKDCDTQEALEFRIDELKKKWKNIRDNYVRDLNQETSVHTNRKTTKTSKKYHYASMLTFLQPVLKKIKLKDDAQKPTVSPQVKRNVSDDCEEQLLSLNETQNPLSVASTRRASAEPPRKKTSTTIENELNSPDPKKIINTKVFHAEEIDSDKAFLLSLLPDVKRMTDNQKLDLKVQFMQSVKNILNPIYASPVKQEFSYYNNS